MNMPSIRPWFVKTKNRWAFWLSLGSLYVLFSCGCSPKPKVDLGPQGGGPYTIRYDYNVDGEIWLRNEGIQLRFDRDLYCRVFLRHGTQLFSVNDIPANEEIARPPSFLTVKGVEIRNFLADYRDIGAADFINQFGPGKRMHLAGYATTADGITLLKTLKIDFFQKYPESVLWTTSIQNRDDKRPVEITRAVNSFFRMDAARANPRAERYSFSCFAGIRIPGQPDWPQVLSTSSRWSGNVGPHPGGDTLPFLDLWCDSMGMAIGEMPAPGQGAHLFLEVAPDKRVEMGFENAAPVILKPGESHTLPRSFLMVHHGDFQGALDRYRQFQTLLRGEKILAP